MNKRSKSQHYLKLIKQNKQLLNRIQKSKPILQTIYDKIKKKQKYLYQKIFTNQSKISQFKHLLHNYQQLYQNSLNIISKNNALQTANNLPSNFFNYHNISIQSNSNKSKSVYQQYKQRINRISTNSQQQKNPQLKVLKRQNEQLKNQMLSDIDRLRIVRQKSHKRLKRAQSSTMMKKQQKQTLTELDQKKKTIQKQRQKLSRIQ